MRIAYVCPNPDDATSFYRGVGPLSCLRHLDPTIEVAPLTECSWSAIAPCDVVFLQRPFAPAHMDIARLAKTLGKKLWVDYDDDVFSVPRSAGDVYRLYRQGQTQQIISAILSWADVVTVTNDYLRDVYSQWASNIVIVPNAYNDYWLPTTLPTEPRDKTIFWRGSVGHVADLAAFADDLVAIAKDFPDWKWSFMGAVPWPLDGLIPGMEYRSPVDIFSYHHIVRDVIRPSIVINPLRAIAFNYGRSDTAALEATYCGATYAGDILELRLALTEKPTFLPLFRLLSFTNLQRLDILRSL